MTTEERCDEMHALITDIAIEVRMVDTYKAASEHNGVEGAKQTIRVCIAVIEAHLNALKQVAAMVLLIVCLLTCGQVRADDDFMALVRQLEAQNAAPPVKTTCGCSANCLCTPGHPGDYCFADCANAAKPRHGDTRPCTDGRGDWTFDVVEGVWWRYRPDWIQPPVASLESRGTVLPLFRDRIGAGGCSVRG